MTERHRRSFFIVVLVLMVAATWLIYLPGLHGGFLFDDFANLPSLGFTGPIDNWAAFWRYITSGKADPLGRPLALLSFLLDAHDWPAAPYPFKRSNLILHLANGVLLALSLRRLGQELSAAYTSNLHASSVRVDGAALLGAGFWIVHPLFVSTTLYVVQREAMLSTTFTLLGLLAWLRGRDALVLGRTIAGLVWMAVGLAGCTMLAVFSKGNGMLLPALALVVECTTMPPFKSVAAATAMQLQNRRAYLYAMALLAWVPTGMVTGYLLYQGWSGLTHGISSLRPWTLGQRLMTEPRVLVDYLQLLWLPRPFTAGLFNDQVHASTSLWSPLTTLTALLTVLGLILGAWLCRRRYPSWALAILFFFVGQSLESSSIPLELYFEHRNYLPAMLMFWPLALWLCGVKLDAGKTSTESSRHLAAEASQIDSPVAPVSNPTHPETVPLNRRFAVLRIAKPLLAAALLCGLGLMTHIRSSLWGNTRDQTRVWAELNPNSPRAQANVAADEMRAGHPGLAVARLRVALDNAPTQAQLAMNLFDAQCQLGHIDQSTLHEFNAALFTTHDPGPLLVNWFVTKIDQVTKPECPELTLFTLGSLLDAAWANPNLHSVYGRRQDIRYLRGRIALMKGDADTALLDFNRGLDEDAQISVALQQAALLGSMGYPRQGLAHLDHYRHVKKRAIKSTWGMASVHSWVLQRQNYWADELAHLRDTLNKNAVHQVNVINESCEFREKDCAR